jgi:hypothetical protein
MRTRSVGRMVVASMVMLVAFYFSATPQPNEQTQRFLAHATTDKPIYRVGERVMVRAVVLSATDHKPLPPDRQGNAMMQITGPKGETLANGYGALEDSVGGFYWDIPDDAAGGQYTVTITFPSDGFPPAVRKFEVRAYRAPRLKGEIVFFRDGFGPGDKVKASLHIERAEGGLPVGATVTPTAVVDGADVAVGAATKIDNAGNCNVEFSLPSTITRGDGTLCLSIADGGVVEPIAKTIPIILNTLDIAMYPEGGDLVAGLESRVYLQARTPAQKPADLVGAIVDSHGDRVADVRTEHEGRARVTFTPKPGESYSLKLSQPAGIEKLFPLPDVKLAGASVRSDHDITAPGEPIELSVAATQAGTYRIALSQRQTEVSSTKISLSAGTVQQVRLTPPASADGVLIATIRNDHDVALAERLVFRKPSRSLHISVAPDRTTYVPADSATLTITSTDDDGKPVGAVVGLTVTDDSILQMLEKRDRAPRLGAMVLLENDVKDLADASVYLDPSDPKAPLAVDLLLGTQGWRRFATADEAKFLAEFGDDARRALADRAPVLPATQTALFGAAANRPRGGMQMDELEKLQLGTPMRHAAFKKDKDALAPAAPANKEELFRDRRFAQLRPEQQMADIPLAASTIRIYAHDLHPGRQPSERTDFTETLYWAAGVKTDAKTGRATVSFKLNDAVSSFKVMADGFDAGGAIGEASATIASV